MRTTPLIRLRSLLCGMLAATTFGLGTAPLVRAELISTQAALEDRSTARAAWIAMLDREDVRAELQQLGIDPAEARARVASLSDAEVEAIQGRLDELPAGASFAGAVAGVLIVTVTVLLFTDLLGFTDVYPFIKPLPRPEEQP